MIVGLRVVKTVISVGISITIARLCGLEPAHFAGIISMLAVQPSIFRSLRHTLSHIASALLAAVLGITLAFAFGSHSFMIAFGTLLIMALHVGMKKTASLQLAVIVTINTMGMADELSVNAAFYQICLVMIGMTVGTAVNIIRKPVHREREEVLLAKSEGMLRSLLHYVILDLETGRITPYKPDMKMQIEDIRNYIEKGKDIALLIREDRRFGTRGGTDTGALFDKYETMVERIRDLVKALQKADPEAAPTKRLIRAIKLLILVQERTIAHKPVPFGMLIKSLQSVEDMYGGTQLDVRMLFPFYQANEALSDYARELMSMHPSAAQTAPNRRMPNPTLLTHPSPGRQS